MNHHLRMAAAVVAIIFTSGAARAGSLSLIRDAETESVIQRTIDPLLSAAGYNPDDISLYLVKDDSINAYVSGGKNVFIHTGLLTFSPDVAVIAGVLAHEIGHITGSHIIRRTEAAGDLTLASAAGLILGLGTGVVAGPSAGTAVFGATQHILQRGFLSETRKQEESADFTAISLMNQAGYTVKGLEALLSHLHVQYVSADSQADPYAQTHPLSGERLQFIRNAADKETDAAMPADLADDYRYVHAKLVGFLGRPSQVLTRYSPESADPEAGTLQAAYGAAVAYYRNAELDKSLILLDELRAREPENPFFDELKAQFLFESGRIDEAATLYGGARKALPDNMLLQAQYAAVLVTKTTPSPEELRLAIRLLEDARFRGEKTLFVLRMLGVAYGKAGDIGLSNITLAEWAIAAGKKEDALTFIALATPHIDTATPAGLRLQDAEDAAKSIKKRK